MATVPEIQDQTNKHLSDMTAAEKHILNSVEGQLELEAIRSDADAFELLSRTREILSRHIDQLETMVKIQDAETQSGLKSMFTRFMGNLTGLYNQIRADEAVRAVRDTYTALNLLSASLVAMKTFGLCVGKESISKLAYEQMREIFPLIMEFNRKLPYIVARELAAKDGFVYDQAVPARVENSTQRIWNRQD